MFVGRDAVIATADNLRIWRRSSMKVEPSVLVTSARFLNEVRESLESSNDPGVQLRVKLAGVEAAKDEMVSA